MRGSGSGIADLVDVIYFNAWVDCKADLTFTGVGGTVTVDLADITYARYLLRGKTMHVQILVETATVGATTSSITVDMPFLPSNVINTGSTYCLGFSPGNGVVVGGFVSGTTLEMFPASGSDFATGTNNQTFNIDITVELT